MADLPTVKTWTGKKLREFSQEAFVAQLKKNLAEVVLITGGKMYDEKKEPMMYKGQLKSISKLLLYSFSFLSFEEIMNAFYLNSAGRFGEVYSHYGRELNVEFIGNVLASYKKFKQGIFNEHGEEILKVIHPQLPPPPERILTDEDYLNDKRKTIEDAYQRLVNSLEINEGLFPEYFYDVLEADGAIEPGLYEKILKDAKNKIAKDDQIETMWKNEKEKMRNGGKKIDDAADDGKSRYENTGHIGEGLKKIRWLASEGLLKKHHPAVTVSKQMIVKEFFLLCFRNNEECVYRVK